LLLKIVVSSYVVLFYHEEHEVYFTKAVTKEDTGNRINACSRRKTPLDFRGALDEIR
jgi:hypothetical protein